MVRIFPRLSDLQQLSRRGLFDLGLAAVLEILLIVALSPILLPLWVIQLLRARARELDALQRVRPAPAIHPPAPWPHRAQGSGRGGLARTMQDSPG